MPFRAPGGVWLSSLLLTLTACGDDGSTGPLGAGGDASSAGGSQASSGAPAVSSASGSTSSAPGSGGGEPSTSTAGGRGGAGGSGQGGEPAGTGAGEQGGGGSGAGDQGGAGQGGDAAGTGGGPGEGGAGGAPGSGGAGGEGAGGGPQGTRVRIMSSNLTSGNLQTYDPGHGIRIIQGVAPDIILVQEMNYGANDADAMRAFADTICGSECDWEREPLAPANPIPNGVVSRYPILESGVWQDPHVSNRELFWARIDMPGPADLVAVSVHLHTTVSSHQGEGEAIIEGLLEEAGDDDLVVLGGDFNTDDTTDLLFPVLDDVFRVVEPWPVDNIGNPNTNGGRTKRYDWVLANAALDALEIPVVVGAQTFPDGLVVDTRVYMPLSDIAPALMNDSSPANSMQHMGVVRDFAFAD